MTSAIGIVATTRPIAISVATVVLTSPAASQAKAPAVISRPIRLPGRRSQATAPATA